MIKKIAKFFKITRLVLKYGEEAFVKDPLTGLYNRFISSEIINKKLCESERYNLSLCIILLDVDKLKQINDTKGHLEGDKALTQVAFAIKKNIRKSDIACRWGGDEFLIMLFHTQRQGAEQFLKRIREQTSIGVSAGISEWKKGITMEQMIAIADKEMYKKKQR